MTCFGFRESRRLERERQREHELELLKAARPTAGENIVTGIKWVFGSVAAMIILPPVIIGAGAIATLEAVTAGAKAFGVQVA